MLALGMKLNERIRLSIRGELIGEIKLYEIHSLCQIKVAFDFPKDIKIDRVGVDGQTVADRHKT